MAVEEITFKSAGATLYGYVWSPDGRQSKGWVVMAHGLTNHHEDAPMFALIRDALLAEGMGVFMFDFFGSGKSDGQFEDKTWSGMRANLADALGVVSETRLSEGDSVALVARSVGASVAAFFAKDARVSSTVLASPVLHVVDRFGDIRPRGSSGTVDMPDSLERSGQIKGPWRLNERFFDELEETQQQMTSAVVGAKRVLVLHGDEDPKVSESNSGDLFGLLEEPKEYVRVAGGDHYYTGQENTVLEATVRWVMKYTAVRTV